MRNYRQNNVRPVPPVVHQAEIMPLQIPRRVIRRGERFPFPSRTDRGDWPVIGLQNVGLQNITQASDAFLYLTLRDASGNNLLGSYPLGLLPINFLLPVPGQPFITAQFAHMPVCWENSYFETANQFFTPNDGAIVVIYGRPQ